MIPLVKPKEQSFNSVKDLQESLSSRDLQDYPAKAKDIDITEEGILRTQGFEGSITQSGWSSLLETLSVPEQFASLVCPPDLATDVVNRLLKQRREELTIRTVNGAAHGIISQGRVPVEHDILTEWIPNDISGFHATLGPDALRITFSRDEEEALPEDVYQRGWEVVSDENGLYGTEAHGYLRRLICQNGMVGFEESSSFRRSKNSREAVFEDLAGLRETLDSEANWPLQKAARWASERSIEGRRDMAVNHFQRQLEGRTTRRLLEDVTADSTWYDLMNTLTEQARTRPLIIRRRYENSAGQLFRWFQSEGRAAGPWEDSRCGGCEYFQNEGALVNADE